MGAFNAAVRPFLSEKVWNGYAYLFSKSIQWNRTHKDSLSKLADYVIQANAQTVVEFCCGTGMLLRVLRAKGWRGKYVGIDYSSSMLAYKPYDQNATFICGDIMQVANSLPHVDVVVCHNGLYKSSEEAARRVVKIMAQLANKMAIISEPVYIDPEAVAKGENNQSTRSIPKALAYLLMHLTLYKFIVTLATLIYFELFINDGGKIINEDQWHEIFTSSEVKLISNEATYASTGKIFVFSRST